MRLADQLKALVFTRARATAAHCQPAPADQENPYLAARRTWNEHMSGVVSSRQAWQMIAILCLLIVLATVGGIIHVASQSKFVPYVVEVDKLGQAVAVSEAQRAAPADTRVI